MSPSEQRRPHPSDNKAVGARVPGGKTSGLIPLTGSSASRHHTDSLGASTAREKG